jgi:hypothetical protein
MRNKVFTLGALVTAVSLQPARALISTNPIRVAEKDILTATYTNDFSHGSFTENTLTYIVPAVGDIQLGSHLIPESDLRYANELGPKHESKIVDFEAHGSSASFITKPYTEKVLVDQPGGVPMYESYFYIDYGTSIAANCFADKSTCGVITSSLLLTVQLNKTNLGPYNTSRARALEVPAPIPLLGVSAAFGFSHKLRKRIKSSGNSVSSSQSI